MPITTDPNHPGLGKGPDDERCPQHDTYLVLSEEERAKGFVRPVRETYYHVGDRPKHPLVPLTPEQQERYGHMGYVAYEAFPESMRPQTGRFWTQAQLDAPKGCGMATTMGRELAETYARDPYFYGSTYCVHCQMHRPVREFEWEDGEIVGS